MGEDDRSHKATSQIVEPALEEAGASLRSGEGDEHICVADALLAHVALVHVPAGGNVDAHDGERRSVDRANDGVVGSAQGPVGAKAKDRIYNQVIRSSELLSTPHIT